MTVSYILMSAALVFLASFVLVFLPVWSIAQCHLIQQNKAKGKRREEKKRR